jgi:hypothetical protein
VATHVSAVANEIPAHSAKNCPTRVNTSRLERTMANFLKVRNTLDILDKHWLFKLTKFSEVTHQAQRCKIRAVQCSQSQLAPH